MLKKSTARTSIALPYSRMRTLHKCFIETRARSQTDKTPGNQLLQFRQILTSPNHPENTIDLPTP